LIDPLLKLAGVKSGGAFAKGASSVGLEEDSGAISVVPSRNLGVDEGFKPERERRRLVEGGSDEALGAVVRQTIQGSP
jgi:hypothetical protein